MNTVLDKDIAKWNLAVNLWDRLTEIGEGYKWLAEEMTVRTGEEIYPSRIQKILHQTSSPDWSFVLNLCEILGCTVDDLAKKPAKSAENRYKLRFPGLFRKTA